MTPQVGHQTYKFGWVFAVSGLTALNLRTVNYLTNGPTDGRGVLETVLGAAAMACGVVIGVAAAAVRPWSWYVVVATQPVGLMWPLIYFAVVRPDWRVFAISEAVVLILTPICFAYFYKRRAMFGAARRWRGLEQWCPMLIGSETRDPDWVPGFAGLSWQRRGFFIAVVLTVSLIR